ncbi:MAG: endonuclease domain-containing protein, partial [Flavitalea sp.]
AYIADFYCFKTKLIIEIDGSIHLLPDIKELDQARQNDLEELGYTILRFTNSQVLNDINKVLFVITRMLTLSSSNQSNT